MASPGEPWPHADPWAEQERRRQAHERRRRRRRVAWIAPVVLVVFVAARGLYLITGDGSAGERPATTEPAATSSAAPTTAATVILPPPSTLAPGAVVRLEEVWLLDRRDGTYDWGLVVTSTDDVDREEVMVTARLLDENGEVVAVVDDEIGVLPAGGRAAAGGVIFDPGGVPVRIETDVAVGRRGAAAENGTLAVVAVERRPDPDGGGELLTGRVSSTFADEVEAVRVAAIWRDESGAVVAAAFRDVDRVRPRVEARFELVLDGLVVPDGLPAEVLVVR